MTANRDWSSLPAAHFAIICTGRDTHPVVQVADWNHARQAADVMARDRHRKGLSGAGSRVEWRCPLPACPCNLRLGRRQLDRMIEAAIALGEAGKTLTESGYVPVDISKPELLGL